MNIAVIIPALRPSRALVQLAEELSRTPLARILIVDDGSGEQFAGIFAECAFLPKVEVLPHAINQGKGAALKTGLRRALALSGVAGVVTADADGQHQACDILRVAKRLEEQPELLILGSRQFGAPVPWRSRVGNVITRALVRLLVGQALTDTQTGLRGIPRALALRLLEIPATGYEFELDMLIAARHAGCRVREEPIRTIYEDGNRGSHFDPLFDSMRIYFVLLRFSALSLMTAAVDNFFFFLAWTLTGGVAPSQVVGRVAGVLFNYGAARRAVFLSSERHRVLLPKYLAVVVASGLASYGLIGLLRAKLGLPVMAAKVVAESLLFILNFAILRDVVFRRGEPRAEALLAPAGRKRA